MKENLSIYDKYGGYDFFHQCIYDLYLDMFDHPEISYHFIGVNIEKLSKLQTQFLVRAIGGPDQYDGGLVRDVHLHMEITPYEYNEIAKAFKSVFTKNGVENKDVDFIMNFVTSHRPDIVTAKVNFIDRLMKFVYRIYNKLRRLI